MGLLHVRGYGIPKNLAAAARWFRKAAEQGMPEAQFDLGYLYRRGEGVPQDDLKAVDWWQKAADQGDTFAQSSLAGMYLDGNGVKKILSRPTNRCSWPNHTNRGSLSVRIGSPCSVSPR